MGRSNINLHHLAVIAATLCLSATLIPGTPGNKAGLEPAVSLDHASLSCPGEFERQQTVWLQWPPAEYNKGAQPVYPLMINIIRALDSYITVSLIVRNKEEISQIKSLLQKEGYCGTNISFYIINHLSVWARDVGPTFVRDGRGRLGVVDFAFNDYGQNNDRYYVDVEGQIDKLIGQKLGLPIISTHLVAEGGAIESNGRGTLMTTESVALKRNPALTKEQIAIEYKRVLGARKIIWLKQGLAEDDRITGGHIDEIARFADPHTILLATVLPGDRYTNRTSQESYLRLEENYRILSASTDQDGKPFRIIRVPMPPTLYREPDKAGRVPVRSYLNYTATNGAILLPAYWRPGRPLILKQTEEDVRYLFGQIFPGRTIISLDAESVNLWGGGIHCITRHMPLAGPVSGTPGIPAPAGRDLIPPGRPE